MNVDLLLKKVYESLSTVNEVSVHGFYSDTSGISLFLFYYSLILNDEKCYNKAVMLLEKTLMSYYQTRIAPADIARLGWLLVNLDSNDFLETDVNELIDKNENEVLCKTVRDYLKNDNYDFLHAALGIIQYFLSKNDIESRFYVSEFVDEFAEKAERAKDNELKWLSTLDIRTKTKGYNISMSHGLASIIAMLSKIYKQGINQDKTKYLLEGAMNYLLQQKLPNGKYISVFPNFAIESMKNLAPSRLAWCYGDLGISVAIWHASQALRRKDWEEEAINILLHSAQRRDLKENSVIDAGLCHGTAGIAHIYSRMHGYTGVEELKEASEYWFGQTLKMARFEDGLAGFKTWHGLDKGWKNEPGLLEGIAGIGLAMISAVSDIEPTWDECLLLS